MKKTTYHLSRFCYERLAWFPLAPRADDGSREFAATVDEAEKFEDSGRRSPRNGPRVEDGKDHDAFPCDSRSDRALQWLNERAPVDDRPGLLD